MSDSDNDRGDKKRSRRHSSEEHSRKKHKSRRERDQSLEDEVRNNRGDASPPASPKVQRARNKEPVRKDKRYHESPHDNRRRDRSRSASQDRAVAKRYWGSKNNDDRSSRRSPKASNEQYPLGDRYYGKTEADVKAEPPPRKPKDDLLNTRTGGAYIPPARLRMMQAQITDKSTAAYQRIAWEALKKSIHGHINKINVGNIGIIIKQLLKENIVRGRGLLSRSIIQAQAASPTFTNVYAALVAAVNSRFPNVGELLLKRLIIQFKRGFKRNDKSVCISAATFVAHLVNQRVAHEILALELLTLLVETPTDDSVEVAIAFLKECGQKLTEVSSKGVNAIFEMLRNILHEGSVDKRVQYMIEVIFQVWKDGFEDHPAVIEELELVPEEEQFTHLMMLDEATDAQDLLNVFKLDEKYEENEQKYKDLASEILGSDADSDEEGSGSGSGDETDDEDEEEAKKDVTIIDNTETNLIALRRTIYLTINSSLDFEECAHKLMKMQLKPGQEIELCHMFLDCCAEQRTYEKFYGLLAQRFCQINKIYIGPFEEIFKDSYGTAHRLDTNRLRNVSKFFAHLLFTDSISWEVLECVKLNEEDTTSSSRIYIKILFQELAEYMGLKKLNDRLRDPTLQEAFQGLFPRDNPKNTRFSINFFTSIGLGGLTDDLREHLKQIPKNVPQQITEINVSGSSSSSSSSDSSSSDDSSSSSSSSSSESDDDEEKAKRKKKSDKNFGEKSDKDKSPNKETEKWGHDGFYDTYGKDAVRETRTRNRDDDRSGRNRDGHHHRPEVREFEREDDRRHREDSRNSQNRTRDIRRDGSIRNEIPASYWNTRNESEKDRPYRRERHDDGKEENKNDNENRRKKSDNQRSKDNNNRKEKNDEDRSPKRPSSIRKDGDREEPNSKDDCDQSSRRKEKKDKNNKKHEEIDQERKKNNDDRTMRSQNSQRGMDGEQDKSKDDSDYKSRRQGRVATRDFDSEDSKSRDDSDSRSKRRERNSSRDRNDRKKKI